MDRSGQARDWRGAPAPCRAAPGDVNIPHAPAEPANDSGQRHISGANQAAAARRRTRYYPWRRREQRNPPNPDGAGANPVALRRLHSKLTSQQEADAIAAWAKLEEAP
ncbi:MAG: hypothetical protein HZA66_01110 [Rhodopseudomonas palustris]|uniref:Uncharacterized protein n=1 Tax=Rhodopseudomonas palustris TaxID=1076 RepID=A0A933VZN4_RHOPL|nr:hypothetical protein [Rhodopseudomonas palustris]